MEYKVAIIGLGYVGLPLAIEFSKFKAKYGIVYDIKSFLPRELSNFRL